MKLGIAIRAAFLLLIGSSQVNAQLEVKASFGASDPKSDSSTQKVPSVQLYVLDAEGRPVKKAIDKSRSGALNLSKWSVQRGDAGSETLTFDKLKVAPSDGGLATELTAWLPSDVGDADLTKDDWHLLISGTGSAPALRLLQPDGSVQLVKSVDVSVEPMPEREQKMLMLKPDFSHQLTLGGGEDGSIVALALHFNPPPELDDDDQPHGPHFDFDGTFTPNPEDSLKIYGKFEGDAGWFHSYRVGPSDFVRGSVRLVADTHFEGDQLADNYNWTVGVGAWGFLGFKPMTLFSRGLYSALNFGQKTMKDAPVLTLFTGYEYVASSKHDAAAEPQGDQRVRFRARYRTPLWRDVDLPVLPTVFDVDGVADFSGVWDLSEGQARPEIKASIEFMPRSVADHKLAFAVTYASGKVAPTFEDEEAFLAGLRWRF